MLIEYSLISLLFIAVGVASAQNTPDRPTAAADTAETDEPAATEKVAVADEAAGDSLLYGRHGSMRTKPGQRDTVLSILLESSDDVASAGCLLYVVSRDPADPDLIMVTEVWTSRDAHQASLELPSVREAIGRAMPMLTGEFTAEEFEVVGGLGLPKD